MVKAYEHTTCACIRDDDAHTIRKSQNLHFIQMLFA